MYQAPDVQALPHPLLTGRGESGGEWRGLKKVRTAFEISTYYEAAREFSHPDYWSKKLNHSGAERKLHNSCCNTPKAPVF